MTLVHKINCGFVFFYVVAVGLVLVLLVLSGRVGFGSLPAESHLVFEN